MHRGQTERADRDPLEPPVRERALKLERLRELRGLSQGREETDRLVVQASKRDLDRTRRRRVEPLRRRRGRQGPAPARTRHVGRPAPQVRLHADRAASRRAPRAAAPPPAPAAAEARARARPRRARPPAAPRARRTRVTPRPLRPGRSAPGRDAHGHPRRPPPTAPSSRCPPRPRGRARPGPSGQSLEERTNRAELFVAPDDSRFTHRLGHCGRREPRLSSVDRLRGSTLDEPELAHSFAVPAANAYLSPSRAHARTRGITPAGRQQRAPVIYNACHAASRLIHQRFRETPDYRCVGVTSGYSPPMCTIWGGAGSWGPTLPMCVSR